MKKKKPLITNEQIDNLLNNFGVNDQDTLLNPVFNLVDDSDYKTEFITPSDEASELSQQEITVETVIPTVSDDSVSHSNKTNQSVSAAKIPGRFFKISAVFIMLLFLTWFLPSGNVMNLAEASSSAKDRDTFFEVSSLNLMSNSLSEIYAMPSRYVLEMSDILTPAPDKSKFERIYDEERKSFDGEKIYHYKDDSIEVKCWREKISGCIYNFSEVWVSDATQLRRTLVDNVISKKHMDFPQNIFKKTNGVVGMSADYCAFRPYGIVIQYGNVIRRRTSGRLDIAVFDKMGNFCTYADDPSFFESDVYKNGDVIHTFAFGPTLVDDYKVSKSKKLVADPWEQPGEMRDNYPRAAICQFDFDKHYLLCTVNYKGTNVTDFAHALQSKGVRFAYNLDGGQTATLLFNKEIINEVAYGGPRQMSDILYFATAIPEKTNTEGRDA